MADVDSGAGGYQQRNAISRQCSITRRQRQRFKTTDDETVTVGKAIFRSDGAGPNTNSIDAVSTTGTNSTASVTNCSTIPSSITGVPTSIARPPQDSSPILTNNSSPEQPREFISLISGISSMQDTIKSKDETIKQLQRELGKFTSGNIRKEGDVGGEKKETAAVDEVTNPKSPNISKIGHHGRSPKRIKRKSPRKSPKKQSEDQKAAVEAFMEKVRRRESTSTDWERLVKLMAEKATDNDGAASVENSNRSHYKEKLSVVLQKRGGSPTPKIPKEGTEGGSGQRGSKFAKWFRESKLVRWFVSGGEKGENNELPSAEEQMMRMAIKVAIVAIIMLAAIEMMCDLDNTSGGPSTGVIESKNMKVHNNLDGVASSPLGDERMGRATAPFDKSSAEDAREHLVKDTAEHIFNDDAVLDEIGDADWDGVVSSNLDDKKIGQAAVPFDESNAEDAPEHLVIDIAEQIFNNDAVPDEIGDANWKSVKSSAVEYVSNDDTVPDNISDANWESVASSQLSNERMGQAAAPFDESITGDAPVHLVTDIVEHISNNDAVPDEISDAAAPFEGASPENSRKATDIVENNFIEDAVFDEIGDETGERGEISDKIGDSADVAYEGEEITPSKTMEFDSESCQPLFTPTILTDISEYSNNGTGDGNGDAADEGGESKSPKVAATNLELHQKAAIAVAVLLASIMMNCDSDSDTKASSSEKQIGQASPLKGPTSEPRDLSPTSSGVLIDCTETPMTKQ